jgi:hypothetical protein
VAYVLDLDSGDTVNLEWINRKPGMGFSAAGITFTPDGTRVVVVPEGLNPNVNEPLIIWDAHTGAQLLTIENFRAPMVFSPDGCILAVADRENAMRLVRTSGY